MPHHTIPITALHFQYSATSTTRTPTTRFTTTFMPHHTPPQQALPLHVYIYQNRSTQIATRPTPHRMKPVHILARVHRQHHSFLIQVWRQGQLHHHTVHVSTATQPSNQCLQVVLTHVFREGHLRSSGERHWIVGTAAVRCTDVACAFVLQTHASSAPLQPATTTCAQGLWMRNLCLRNLLWENALIVGRPWVACQT